MILREVNNVQVHRKVGGKDKRQLIYDLLFCLSSLCCCQGARFFLCDECEPISEPTIWIQEFIDFLHKIIKRKYAHSQCVSRCSRFAATAAYTLRASGRCLRSYITHKPRTWAVPCSDRTKRGWLLVHWWRDLGWQVKLTRIGMLHSSCFCYWIWARLPGTPRRKLSRNSFQIDSSNNVRTCIENGDWIDRAFCCTLFGIF